MGGGGEEGGVCKPFFLLATTFCPLVEEVLFHTGVTSFFRLSYPSCREGRGFGRGVVIEAEVGGN